MEIPVSWISRAGKAAHRSSGADSPNRQRATVGAGITRKRFFHKTVCLIQDVLFRKPGAGPSSTELAGTVGLVGYLESFNQPVIERPDIFKEIRLAYLAMEDKRLEEGDHR